MKRSCIVRQFVLLPFAFLFVVCFAEQGFCQPPVKVTLCQLTNDPAAYNHKLIEITAFVSHAFEDFSLFDPVCDSKNSVWLEYGGKRGSGTIYCCGVTYAQRRQKLLVVEKIPIPLIDDQRFREFDRLLNRFQESSAHATIVGYFFSGKKQDFPGGTFWTGYGHMGMSSLLAIHQITSVDPQDRNDLDYGGSPDYPKMRNDVGCWQRHLEVERAVEAQRKAESIVGSWAFSDPLRVALDYLSKTLKIDEKSIKGLREVRRRQGRIVYQWHPRDSELSYLIVVTRPYLLSYAAKDPNQVAWTVWTAYEYICGQDDE